jgi:ChaB protein
MMARSSRYRLSAGELPATLQRSSAEAQAMFRKAREEAVRAYGEGDEAYRAAYVALKKKFEKCGDRWIARAEPAA